MPDRVIPTSRPIAKPNPALQDHLPKHEVAETSQTEEERDIALESDELLADMPTLKPAHRLRVREKNRLMRLVLESGLMDSDGAVEFGGDLTDPAAMKMLDLIAGIDEFAESIALDKEAYAEWSEGQEYDVFLALMNRYAGAVGK